MMVAILQIVLLVSLLVCWSPAAEAHMCILKLHWDPSAGRERWAMPRNDICYCQGVKAARNGIQYVGTASCKVTQEGYDGSNLWYTDNPGPLTKRDNWTPEKLNELLGRTEFCTFNECISSPCLNGGACIDDIGSFICHCKNGYTGATCDIDQDECSGEGSGHNCDVNAECTNTDGSFTCVCNPGWNGDGSNCIDQDECSGEGSGHNCDVNAECTNTDGSFTCECNPGWTSDGSNCIDQDECSGEGSGPSCDSNAACTNTDGSFTCECNPGWTGDGFNCTDQDECSGEGSGHNCHSNAECTNTDGSFKCECNPGWNGDGFNCTDCVIPLGMEDGTIQDNQINASSEYSISYIASKGRLNGDSAWCAASKDLNQWIQADLGESMLVSGLVVQGLLPSNEWITKYTVVYSNDGGLSWMYIRDINQQDALIFNGNTDANTPVQNLFPATVVTTTIRIHPTEWHGYICLRFEVVGCKNSG